MKFEKLTDCLETLYLFASDTRLKILCAIGKGRMTGVEILKHFDIKQSSLTYHLRLMVKAGILNGEEIWKYTYYTINSDKIKELVKSFSILNEVTK